MRDETEMQDSNRAFYDRIARFYDRIADGSEHEARAAGEEALGLRAGERVLEIGFGTGNGVVELARRVSPGGRVEGVDVSEGMLAVAMEKVREQGLEETIGLRIADGRSLPFEDGTFDAVFLSFTLELFSDEDIPRVLGEVRRVLRPSGGRLGVVSMAKAEGHESLLERGYVWMHRHFPHIVDCEPIAVRRLVEEGGFEILHEETVTIWTMPVAIVVGKKR